MSVYSTLELSQEPWRSARRWRCSSSSSCIPPCPQDARPARRRGPRPPASPTCSSCGGAERQMVRRRPFWTWSWEETAGLRMISSRVRRHAFSWSISTYPTRTLKLATAHQPRRTLAVAPDLLGDPERLQQARRRLLELLVGRQAAGEQVPDSTDVAERALTWLSWPHLHLHVLAQARRGTRRPSRA